MIIICHLEPKPIEELKIHPIKSEEPKVEEKPSEPVAPPTPPTPEPAPVIIEQGDDEIDEW